ncbi:hypothetical protein COCON_G00161530 [Conger conger]|uniref:TGFBR3/Endoglin-like N-terminal domain-containing protein n=1 Tax=Conger conger TaxID=82655 RepID=A0A9Q1HVF7_CONCO|nr:hypothetical protein COCON_G00161530 [Conger conger]
MGPGCWSSFSNGSRDVHVLHLLPGKGLVAVDLTAARPAELIISCDSDTTVFFYHNKNVTIHSSRRCTVMGAEAVPFHFDDLLSRVVEEFGGVSSFTTLTSQDPITFTGHTAPGGGSVECTPKADFSQKTTSWCTAPPMSFCSLDPNAAEREVHVIVIPDDVEIRNVSIGFVSQQKITLVLKGPNGTLWTIPAPPDQLSILCSNQFLLPDFLAGPTLRYVKDSAQSFWTNVQLKVGNFTSYTEIRGGGSSLRLVIGRGDRPAPEPRPSAAEPAAGPWPPRPQTPLQLQLSDGPDHRTPLPSAQITPGSMIYANVSSWNRPFLTLAVTGCRVRSCPATRELLLVTQSCSSFSCLLVLSLPPGPDQRRDQWREQPSLGWVLECTVQLCSDVGGKTDCEARSAVRNVEVLGSSPRPSLTPQVCVHYRLLSPRVCSPPSIVSL